MKKILLAIGIIAVFLLAIFIYDATRVRCPDPLIYQTDMTVDSEEDAMTAMEAFTQTSFSVPGEGKMIEARDITNYEIIERDNGDFVFRYDRYGYLRINEDGHVIISLPCYT